MPGILDNLGKKFNSISPMEYFQFGAGILGQPNNVGLGIQQGLLGASQAREQMEERKRHEALGAAIKDTSLPMELRSLLSALPPDQAGMALAQYMMQSKQQEKLYNVGPGASLVNDAGAVVFQGPKPTTDRTEAFNNEKKLRDEFTQQSKQFRDVERAFMRIKKSAFNPTAAGDLSLIFNYMKMLDPTSVVRESEFATAASSGSYGARIQGLVNKTLRGERLAQEVRDDFLSRSKDLYDGAKEIFKGTTDYYSGLSNEYGLDSTRVVAPERVQEVYRAVGPDGQQIIYDPQKRQWVNEQTGEVVQ